MSFRKCRRCGRAMAFFLLCPLWGFKKLFQKGAGASSGSGPRLHWIKPLKPTWESRPPADWTVPRQSPDWRRWSNIFLVFSHRGSDGLYDWLPTPCSLPLPTPTQRRQWLLAARVTLRFCRRLISWRGRPPPLQLCDRGLALDDGDICPIIPEGGTPAAHFQFISMSLPATANWIKPPRSWEAVWSRSFYCRPKGPEEQKKTKQKNKKTEGFLLLVCLFSYKVSCT